MDVLTGIFVIVLAGIGAGTISEIAKAFGRRGAAAEEIADLKTRMDTSTAALEDTQDALASQATQIAELQERVDFAERVLAQVRNRQALGPGDG